MRSGFSVLASRVFCSSVPGFLFQCSVFSVPAFHVPAFHVPAFSATRGDGRQHIPNIEKDTKNKGVVAPPRKLFPNWTKISIRTTHDWQIKFTQANEKHSSEQVLHFPKIKRLFKPNMLASVTPVSRFPRSRLKFREPMICFLKFHQ